MANAAVNLRRRRQGLTACWAALSRALHAARSKATPFCVVFICFALAPTHNTGMDKKKASSLRWDALKARREADGFDRVNGLWAHKSDHALIRRFVKRLNDRRLKNGKEAKNA